MDTDNAVLDDSAIGLPERVSDLVKAGLGWRWMDRRQGVLWCVGMEATWRPARGISIESWLVRSRRGTVRVEPATFRAWMQAMEWRMVKLRDPLFTDYLAIAACLGEEAAEVSPHWWPLGTRVLVKAIGWDADRGHWQVAVAPRGGPDRWLSAAEFGNRLRRA